VIRIIFVYESFDNLGLVRENSLRALEAFRAGEKMITRETIELFRHLAELTELSGAFVTDEALLVIDSISLVDLNDLPLDFFVTSRATIQRVMIANFTG